MSDPEAVPRRRRWRLSIVVVAATALVLAAVGVWAVAADRSRPCTGRSVTVTVAASAGQFTALDRLARDWRATKPTVGGRCAAAAVVLVPAHRVADALPAACAPTCGYPSRACGWRSRRRGRKPGRCFPGRRSASLRHRW